MVYADDDEALDDVEVNVLLLNFNHYFFAAAGFSPNLFFILLFFLQEDESFPDRDQVMNIYFFYR